MTRFDTPRDRSTIEDLKDIYFLSSLYVYDFETPYFDPVSQTVILKPEDDEPECFPNLVPLYDLFDVPDGHSCDSCFKWHEHIEQLEIHGQIPEALKNALNALILLDSELVSPQVRSFFKVSRLFVWNCRISEFLKGNARGLSEPQNQALMVFIKVCKDERLKDLDKFYVPSVELFIDDR